MMMNGKVPSCCEAETVNAGSYFHMSFVPISLPSFFPKFSISLETDSFEVSLFRDCILVVFYYYTA